MSEPVQKLSFREKAGYSLGDSSANFVFQTLLMYQMFFYTDVFGISAAAAGFLFLIGRLFDAVTDPLMGIVADRTRTRWGRFRPWLIWSAPLFALAFWITFTTPPLSEALKLVYAYVTYLVLMAMYTVNNVPYSALNGVITSDVNERTSLSTYRFVAVTITTFIVQGLTAPLVAKFGDGDVSRGWSVTIALFAVVAFIFFFITFASVKERVIPDPNQETSVKKDFSDILHNKPWIILFCATFLIFTMLAFRGGSLYVYFNYNVDPGAMQGFVSSLGLSAAAAGETLGWFRGLLDVFGLILRPDGANAPSVGFGLFNMAGNLVTVVGVLLSKPLSERFGKKPIFATSMICTSIATSWLFVIPVDNIGLMFVQGLTWAACYGPSIPLLWSMIADAADYSEWKNHRRATGFVFAGVVFALKAGLGIGGFLGSMVLAAHGYQANVAQTQESLLGIRMAATIYPGLAVLAAGIMTLFYPISKEFNYRIASELEERRRQWSAATT